MPVGEGRDLAGRRIEQLDLVVVGIGDEDHAVDAPRRRADAATRTSSPLPSRSPKSNRSPPASVVTRLAGGSSTARIVLDSASATYSVLPSIARPDGCAKAASLHGAIAPRLFAGAGVRIGAVVQEIDHPDLVRCRPSPTIRMPA